MTRRPFTYGSVCSGIEAATCAWHPLGWRASFFSEIDAFPRAVLRHRWPDVALHGDFTTIEAGQYEPIDLLVGGTPCQSFSVAGLRGGLADERGNLALEYLRLADRLRPRWLVWENVPGVFSSVSHGAPDPSPPNIDLGGDDGPEDGQEVVVVDDYDADESHAFACLLAGFSELGYGFAYRVLDAQFFGVAQRRRRVFVVGYLGDWRRAAAVLFERHGLSGHPAPRREAGQKPAPTISARPTGGGGLGTDFDLDGGCVVTAPTLRAGGNRTGGNRPYGTDVDTCDSLVVADAATVHAFDARQPLDTAGYSTAIAYSIMPQNSGKDYKARVVDVAQPVMAGGPTGGNQGGDYIVHAIQAGALRENPDSGPDGVGVQQDHAYTLEARAEVQAVAYAIRSDAQREGVAKTPSADAEGNVRLRNPGLGITVECAPTLDASAPHAVAFALRGREGGAMPEVGGEVANTLRTPGGGASVPMVAASAVRRLTPRECERLQGFEDDYTLIPWRGGAAADGPRYKALGNSMAVPVMAWIAQRIAMVEALDDAEAAA